MAVPRNKSVNAHQFAITPRSDVPRSTFRRQSMLKTTFDGGQLVPIYVDEVLPGDSFKLRMNAFARMATPIFPVMDNIHFETFFFFVPLRLVWDNFQKFMGEQKNPGDSIDYVTPKISSPAGGWNINSLFDYFGIPTVGQIAPAGVVTINAFASRAYNLVWNDWFRDQNLQQSAIVDTDDGPDTHTDYVLRRRGKRHDYFTSCLPWPQKGDPVELPLGTNAPIYSNAAVTGDLSIYSTVQNKYATMDSASNPLKMNNGTGTEANRLYADLSQATAATINTLRLSVQVQAFLEKNARGGTRYTEIIRNHFGVTSPDARLQRPEYLGGGHSMVVFNSVAQTTGDTAPVGELSAYGVLQARDHGFSQSFTEHGILLGLANIRADLTYQQGIRKMFTRNTLLDYYFPTFAHLGEQAVLMRELFARGTSDDNKVFGYQERWAEYRYFPSQICGYFRSTVDDPIDAWHLAQEFLTEPALNQEFIEDKPPIDRVVAVHAAADGVQFLLDAMFDITSVRPLPMYSVPTLGGKF